MTNELSTLKKMLESKGRIIKNPKVFEKGYLPKSLVETEKIVSLYKKIVPIIKYEKSKNILICGEPGTGKTVTVRFAQEIIKRTLAEQKKEEILFSYANCRDKTASAILGTLLGKDPSGLSETKLIETLISSLHQNNLNLVLILDEIDRAEKVSNLLYSLSRTKEVFPDFLGSISLILIANDKRWEEELDKPVRSSLQLKRIIFGLYSINKIQQILQDRIKAGFHMESNITKSRLYKIAKFTVEKKKSDTRFAIESLFESAQRAEENNRVSITDKDIETAFVTVEEEIERESISTLSDSHFFVLYSCSDDQEINFSHAYQRYLEIIRKIKNKNVRKVGHSRFRKIIDSLSNQNLLVKLTYVHEIGKRDMRILVKIRANALEEEYDQRIKRLSF
jgi:Cdc6-like AAA superfamily ATPase